MEKKIERERERKRKREIRRKVHFLHSSSLRSGKKMVT